MTNGILYVSIRIIIKYYNSKDRGAITNISFSVRHSKAVADMKGEIAEEKCLLLFSGHAENIRMTVAYAESYVLIKNFRFK